MGPDEFSTRYPGADEPRARRQRLHQRHDRLAAATGPRRARRAADHATDRARRAPRHHGQAELAALARYRAPDVRPDRAGRRSSASSRATGISRSWTGTTTGAVTATSDDWTASWRRRAARWTSSRSPSRRTCSCCSSSSPPTSCASLLTGLGYALPPEVIPRTIEYYLARTAHGSTLSALVHAWVLARAHRAQALGALRAGAAAATSPTCRAGRPRRACTSARWRDASTCCSGASPGWRRGTTRSGSTPIGRRRFGRLEFEVSLPPSGVERRRVGSRGARGGTRRAGRSGADRLR